MTTTFTTPLVFDPVVPGNIAGSGNYTTNPATPLGSPGIVATATLTQNGNLSITRYFDAAGTIPLDVTTAAMTANTAAVVKIVDNTPFKSFSLKVANGAGSVGNLSNVNCLYG